MLQDESKELSRWLATRPGAKRIAMDALKDMIEAGERKEFERWYSTNAFNFEHNHIEWQWAAWKARAEMAPKCRGVNHSGCNYLAACGSVCNKCGQVA